MKDIVLVAALALGTCVALFLAGRDVKRLENRCDVLEMQVQQIANTVIEMSRK